MKGYAQLRVTWSKEVRTAQGPGFREAQQGRWHDGVALIVKYGKLVPGREQQATELFTETKEFLQEQFETGYITYFEPFIYTTGDWEVDTGFWLTKGERDKLLKVIDTEKFKWIMARAQFVVEHLRFEWLDFGEAITEQVERASKVVSEFAFVH